MKLSLLGSTGSIGTQALDVARLNNIQITALAAGSNVSLMEMQAREFLPQYVAMADPEAAADLKIRLADTGIRVSGGPESVCEATSLPESDTVLNAIVGIQGLQSTLSALTAGKSLALANKESLVTGGSLVMKAAQQKGIRILPVDSEHSAIFQCLQAVHNHSQIKKLILTASGGPFFGKTRQDLQDITPQQALKHPNWSMGAKITIDSATMMNKGLEFIEAAWLFDIDPKSIEVLVHRESIIHSMVVCADNAVLAQLGTPDMRLPIQYALTYPDRQPSPADEPDFTVLSKLTFFPMDDEVFPAVSLCRLAYQLGGTAPAIVNGANEQAVDCFLKGRISFLEITDITARALSGIKHHSLHTMEDIMEADRLAREFVLAAAAR